MFARDCIELGGYLNLVKQRENFEQFQKEELHKLGRELENCRMQHRSLQKEADALYESYALKQTGTADYRNRADEITLHIQEIACKTENAELESARIVEKYHRPKQIREKAVVYGKYAKNLLMTEL